MTEPPTGEALLYAIERARADMEACIDEKRTEYVRLLDLVADDPDLSYSKVADRLGVTKNALMKFRAAERARSA